MVREEGMMINSTSLEPTISGAEIQQLIPRPICPTFSTS
jgi:hypothetical protein